ncbi:MAG: T9SS type A sorting domain-containing protein [candidate division Zixibacteria bacterium]|nr:T9SS type A sorting domain-containing protein [candidate division Zixibacteria bacterium]
MSRILQDSKPHILGLMLLCVFLCAVPMHNAVGYPGYAWAYPVTQTSMKINWTYPSGNHRWYPHNQAYYIVNWDTKSVDLHGNSYTIAGLTCNTKYKIEVQGLLQKRNILGWWGTPQMVTLYGCPFWKWTSPCIPPHGDLWVSIATASTLTANVTWSHPSNFNMIRIGYKRLFDPVVSFYDICKNRGWPPPNWTSNSAVRGWHDFPSSSLNSYTFTGLTHCREYLMVAYGFPPGINVGTYIDAGKWSTVGSICEGAIAYNGSIQSIVAEALPDHKEVLEAYLAAVDSLYGDSSIVQHVVAMYPELSEEVATLLAGGIEEENLTDNTNFFEWMTYGHYGLFQQWQSEPALAAAGLKLEQFMQDSSMALLDTLLQESPVTYPGMIVPKIKIEKTHNSYQGHYETVSITTEDREFEMGGFDFLIAYDASALTFMEATPGQLLEDCGWEYFTYRFGANGNCGSACPSGLLRIVAMADANNGDNHPSCFGPPDTDPHELARMKFLVSANRTLECQYVPIRFFWDDCGDNSISRSDGELLFISRAIYDFGGNLIWDEENDTLYPENARIPFVGAPDYCLNPDPEKPSAVRVLDFVNGGIDIICADSIDARGDVNLNGLSNEIGDAVVFTNYFIVGLAAFTVNVEGQIAASEVNCDGIPLSVADLVYLIRVIIGDALPCPPTGKPQVQTPSEAVLDRTSDGMLSVSSAGLIGAAYLVVEGEVTPVLKAEGMKMAFRFDGTNTRILIYPPFDNNEKSIRGFSGEFLEVKGNLVSAELATVEGVPVKLNLTPAKFALAQNFPNPFNLATQVEFSLPAATDVKLEIYNVMGQLVRTLVDQQLPAGYHKVIWDGRNDAGVATASGVFFYKLRAGDFTETKKMLLLK